MRVRIIRLCWSSVVAVACVALLAGVARPAAAATTAQGAARGSFTYTVTSAGCDGHIVATVDGAITLVTSGGATHTERGSFVLDDESWAPCPGPPSTSVSLTGPGTSCSLQGYSAAPAVIRSGGEVGAGPFRIPCTIAGMSTSLQVTVDGRARTGAGGTSSSGIAVVRFGLVAATGPAVP